MHCERVWCTVGLTNVMIYRVDYTKALTFSFNPGKGLKVICEECNAS